MRTRAEDLVPCPPLVWLPGAQQPGYLLAWMRTESTGAWEAVVTWVRVRGEGSAATYQRMVVTTSSARPLEDTGAYARVPRLIRRSDGRIERLTN